MNLFLFQTFFDCTKRTDTVLSSRAAKVVVVVKAQDPPSEAVE